MSDTTIASASSCVALEPNRDLAHALNLSCIRYPRWVKSCTGAIALATPEKKSFSLFETQNLGESSTARGFSSFQNLYQGPIPFEIAHLQPLQRHNRLSEPTYEFLFEQCEVVSPLRSHDTVINQEDSTSLAPA
jgi:hypothetical protein